MKHLMQNAKIHKDNHSTLAIVFLVSKISNTRAKISIKLIIVLKEKEKSLISKCNL